MVKRLTISEKSLNTNLPHIQAKNDMYIVDLGVSLPNTVVSKSFWLENRGGDFNGILSLPRHSEDNFFNAGFHETDRFPIQVTIEFITVVREMSDLGPHETELHIQIGEKSLKFKLYGYIKPFPAG